MENKRNKKGFTLAELLIVVAIIAVLVAIAIPIFSAQLEKSKEATDQANIRAAYAELVANYLTEDKAGSVTVPAKQDKPKWQCNSDSDTITIADGASGQGVSVTAKTKDDGSYTVAIDASGKVTVK